MKTCIPISFASDRGLCLKRFFAGQLGSFRNIIQHQQVVKNNGNVISGEFKDKEKKVKESMRHTSLGNPPERSDLAF